MPSPRITGLTADIVTLPLKRPLRHASHVRTDTENIVVRCTLSDGTIGWGEGVPREYVTGESADSALELLRTSSLKSQFEPCPDFGHAVRLAERLQLQPVPGDDRECRGNAARCAVELAVLDAYGRSFGEGLSTATQQIASEVYEFRPRVQYSAVVTSTRGLKLRALLLYYRLTGFRQLKVKVGIEGYYDAARLRSIRRWIGSKIGIRVDANEAWSPTEALQRINALGSLDAVEQPVPHEQIDGFAKLRRQVKSPIMLDESLCSMVDARLAVERGRGDRFNLRLSKCGGFIPTLRLAQFAVKHNLTYQLGCQVGESAILTSAGRHFATSVRGLTALEGSYDRHLVLESLAFEDLTFGRGGWAPALGGSGHGAWVDADSVARLSRRREVIVE